MCEIHLSHEIKYSENKIVQCDRPVGNAVEMILKGGKANYKEHCQAL